MIMGVVYVTEVYTPYKNKTVNIEVKINMLPI